MCQYVLYMTLYCNARLQNDDSSHFECELGAIQLTRTCPVTLDPVPTFLSYRPAMNWNERHKATWTSHDASVKYPTVDIMRQTWASKPLAQGGIALQLSTACGCLWVQRYIMRPICTTSQTLDQSILLCSWWWRCIAMSSAWVCKWIISSSLM